MSNHKVVQDDTPTFRLSLREKSGAVVDLSDAQTVTRMKVRQIGETTLKGTVICTKLTGLLLDDGSVNVSAPYNVAGAGGRLAALCPADMFNISGPYEFEVEVTFGASNRILTVHKIERITVRPDF